VSNVRGCIVVATLVAATVAGAGLVAADHLGRFPPPPMPAVAVSPASGTPTGTPPDGGAATSPAPAIADPRLIADRRLGKRSRPVRIDIPAIDVSAPLVPVGVAGNGAIDLPPGDHPHQAGWYELSVTPGQRGRSVIVGHLDSRYSGPAVFYRLGALRPGDTVTVTRHDGIATVFRVDATSLHPRNRFPASSVHGPSTRPELRLITCGGKYLKSKGWSHNIIVTAHLVSWTAAGRTG
jgi:LPXTG-site transpeptidase (sortase) family protein